MNSVFFIPSFQFVLCVGVTFVGEWGVGEQGGSILVFVGWTKRTKRMARAMSRHCLISISTRDGSARDAWHGSLFRD